MEGAGRRAMRASRSGAPDAMTLAKAYGVSLRERTKLDDGLVYTWTIAKTATTKKSAKISVKLRVQNTSKAPIGFLVGGMFNERGDDRFVPEIQLGGEVAAPEDETKVWEVAPETRATIVVK